MSNFLEHGHSEWTDERLFDEVNDVVELLKVPHTEARKAQLRARLARATFEQMERYADAHPEAVLLEGAQ